MLAYRTVQRNPQVSIPFTTIIELLHEAAEFAAKHPKRSRQIATSKKSNTEKELKQQLKRKDQEMRKKDREIKKKDQEYVRKMAQNTREIAQLREALARESRTTRQLRRRHGSDA